MWETWEQSLDWEDSLEEGMATHSSILAWRIPLDRGAWQATVHGVTESDMTKHKHKHIAISNYLIYLFAYLPSLHLLP